MQYVDQTPFSLRFAHQFPRLKKKTGNIARAVSNSNCGEILLWMHRNHWAIDAKMVSYDCGLNGCLNVCHALDVLSLLDPEAMLRGAAHNGRLDTLGYSIVAGLFPEVKKNSAWWAAAVRNSHKAFLAAIRDRIGPKEEANVTYYAAQQQQYTLLEKLIQKYHYETDSHIHPGCLSPGLRSLGDRLQVSSSHARSPRSSGNNGSYSTD